MLAPEVYDFEVVATGNIKHAMLKAICDGLVEAFDRYVDDSSSMRMNPHPFFRCRGAEAGYDIAVSTV